MLSSADQQKLSLSEKNKFSLENYFSYVGLAGFKQIEFSLATLTTIIEHHLRKFNYRNTLLFEAGKTSIQNRAVPSLDINTLFSLMVADNGGYCFQHLELLYAVLSVFGFKVDRLLAKTTLQHSSQAAQNETQNKLKTHELLIVHLHDKQYMVDVGMGSLCLRNPLELKEGEQIIEDDHYRLTRKNDRWTLDTKSNKKAEWFCLYHFFNSSVTCEEIRKAHENIYLTKQHIPIRDDMLFFGKTTQTKRKSLIWREKNYYFFKTGKGIYRSTKTNGNEKKEEFSNLEDVKSFAQKKFV